MTTTRDLDLTDPATMRAFCQALAEAFADLTAALDNVDVRVGSLVVKPDHETGFVTVSGETRSGPRILGRIALEPVHARTLELVARTGRPN